MIHFFDISNRSKQGFWKASLQALPKPFFLEVKDIMWHLLEGELKVPLTCLGVDRVQNQYLELPQLVESGFITYSNKLSHSLSWLDSILYLKLQLKLVINLEWMTTQFIDIFTRSPLWRLSNFFVSSNFFYQDTFHHILTM